MLKQSYPVISDPNLESFIVKFTIGEEQKFETVHADSRESAIRTFRNEIAPSYGRCAMQFCGPAWAIPA